MNGRLRSIVALALPGAAAVYLAFRGGGPAAGLAALAAIGFAAALIVRVQSAPVDAELVGRLARGAILALPGAMVLYFSFKAGGFFPAAPALVAIVLLLILVLRITLADDPFASFGWPVAVAVGAMSLFAIWTLASGGWSDAPARALIDFDRALVYTLALVLPATLPRSSDNLRWMVRGVALAIVVVGVAGLLTRVLPGTFPIESNVVNRRLAFPLTYWNTLGMLVAAGIVLCLHLASSLREHALVRILAAAAIPALAATVFFTFSRGAAVAGIVGLVLYVVLGRPRGLVSAAVAVVPTAVIAVTVAYHADHLATETPTSAAAVSQGHDVAVAVGLCVLGAALLRALMLLADASLKRLRLPERLRRPVTGAAWAAAVLVALVVALAADAPGWASDQYDRFVHTASVKTGGDLRNRFLDPGNNGRIEHWRVAKVGFDQHPARGDGAGTYAVRWMKDRKPAYAGLVVRDAHSLYFEVLDELGVIGLILLGVALLAIMAAFLPFGRGRNRTLYAALFAVGAVWVVHAGVDWDWEMPATGVWLFALGGGALATHAGRAVRRPPSQGIRVLLGVLLLAAAVAPALVLVSQRQLNAGVNAYNDGNCPRAIDRASASIETLDVRPEPYEVLGFCQVLRGQPLLAPPALQKAVHNDPGNWEFRYSLAIVRAAAGLDPMPAARAARRLNPHDTITAGLLRRFGSATPAQRISRGTADVRNESLSVVR
jgi:O-antigen ligase